jgi:hypothetical protein
VVARVTPEQVESRREYWRTYARKRYLANPEFYLERQRLWREKNPDKCRAFKQAYVAKNRAAVNAKNRAYRKKHPERVREYVRKCQRAPAQKKKTDAKRIERVYGLTLEAYAVMYASQNGQCVICSRPFEVAKRKPHVDHDHATGRVRGLLCTRCNAGLGMFGDNVSAMLKAADYVRSEGVCG